ncbi:DNA cytosine methyltransferase [Streptococcus macedonicus]|uniref:DNA cytosine methyltransferase n=1 Tax=Streptococcus macedonicus TaxID=59310 RepID=UPI0022DEF7DB|nr:DNA cytosine methyltransferase [Streptococcus macedonicus]
MKFLDLFAGIGGFRLGLESAGHECVGFCEIDKFARASYKAIHNTEGEIELHDITEVTDEEWRKFRGTVDIICGGFPCQAFSIEGKRKGFLDETRGTLFFEIARAAKEIKPPLLFLENVKGLLSHDKGRTFRTILSTLDELGYDAEWQLLNSKDFGVPQNRERVFIIGHLRGTGGRPVFPIRGKNAEIPIQIIGNADPRKKIGNRTDVYDKTGLMGTLLSSDYKEPKLIQVGSLEGKFQSSSRIYSPEGLAPTIKTMQGGGLEPKIMVIDDQGRKNKKISPKQVVPTLRAQSHGNEPKVVIRQGIVTEDLKIRKLTPRECWRLQAFPDWAFDKAQEVNSNSQLYKQAGNSVTVNVIKEIARYL